MTASAEPTASTRIRLHGAAMVVVLLVQLLLGMANTFWLTVPESGSGWSTATPMGLLMAHAALGVVLLVLAVWIVVLAVRAQDRTWLIASVVGIAGVVVAAGAGMGFMSETSNNGASFVMAVGTAISLAAYALALYRLPATATTT